MPAPLYQRLDEVQEIREEAEDMYLNMRFNEAYDTMEKVISELGSLEDYATKLKDRALLWVYGVEWLSITATSLLTGFAVWTLMIRRALYKEVPSTRTL